MSSLDAVIKAEKNIQTLCKMVEHLSSAFDHVQIRQMFAIHEKQSKIEDLKREMDV